jgi:hypothetical protein
MITFEKEGSSLKITPVQKQPESVVISRSHAEAELADAKKRLAQLESELILAQENVAQKQEVVDKCVELNVVE